MFVKCTNPKMLDNKIDKDDDDQDDFFRLTMSHYTNVISTFFAFSGIG